MQSSSRSRSFKPGLIGASPITDARWLNASCPRSSDRSEHRPAKAEAAGATPAADAIFAPVPQQQQGEFRKLVCVGASPTRGSISWWSWCNSSIVPCEGAGDGANPFGHPNFDGPKLIGYPPPKQRRAYRLG